MLHISTNILKIRKLLGHTQPSFAELMQVTLAMQKSYELKKAKPDIIYLQRLTKLTGLSQETIMDGDVPLDAIPKKGEKVEIGSEDQTDGVPPGMMPVERYIKQLEADKLWLQGVMKTSLAAILGDVRSLAYRQKGMGTVVLQTLEGLANKGRGTLVKEADKITRQTLRKGRKHGSKAAQDN